MFGSDGSGLSSRCRSAGTADRITVLVDREYDPIWWGIVMLILLEIGVIAPPFGLNMLMLKSVSRTTATRHIYLGVLPLIAADITKLALLIAAPSIVLWLLGTKR